MNSTVQQKQLKTCNHLAKSSEDVIEIVVVRHVPDLHEAVQAFIGHELMNEVLIRLQDLFERKQSPAQFPTLRVKQSLCKTQTIPNVPQRIPYNDT